MLKHMWIAAALLGSVACGDNQNPGNPQPDAPPSPDAPGPTFTPPTPIAIALSAMGPDQLQSAVGIADGKFLAAGFAAATPTGDKKLTVVRLLATGQLDTTFDGDGILDTGINVLGGADEIDIAVQTDGKIVVSASVPTVLNIPAGDANILLARFNADGTPDNDFGGGGNGRRVIDLGLGVLDGTNLRRDAARGLAVAPDGKIYIHGLQPAPALADPAANVDFVVLRFTSAGADDNAFSGDGRFELRLSGTGEGPANFNKGNATARAIRAFADGTVIASGYQTTQGIAPGAQPVLYRLTAAGELDTTFAGGSGLFHEPVLATQTEVYNFAVHGDHIVTAGYGRTSAMAGAPDDYVSLRFKISDGSRDLTWGGTTDGAVVFDPSGNGATDNCRNAIALPNGGTAMIGSTGQGNMQVQDAVFAILDAQGRLDTRFGDGIHSYPLGANGNDQFWGGAVSGNKALFVGYKGESTQTADKNDNAYAVVLPLP